MAIDIAEVMRPVSFPFFSVQAVRLVADGQSVYAFEYVTTIEAEAAARTIAPDGYEIAGTKISWVSAPHFFRSDRMIVAYIGQGSDMLSALERLLGAPIAGH